MKRKRQEQEKKISSWNGFIIISISVFVFLRFFVDGLSYPQYNFFWNIYFFLLTIIHILIKKADVNIGKEGILLLLFFIVSTISTEISPIKGTGITFNTQLLAYWCIFFLIKETFTTDELKNVLLFTIIISGLFVCIYGLYQYFVGFEETRQFIYSRPELLKTLPPTFLERIISNRVFATFVYPNVFASFLLFLIPLSFFFTFSSKNLITKGIAILTMVLAVWNMFLTNSSGGIYILLFILQIMLIYLIFDKRKLKIILPVVIILEIAIVCGGYITGKLPKMISFVDRVRYWKASTEIFKHHPLFGVGSDNYRYYYTKYKVPGAMEAKHPHSILFASLSETGITGTFFLLSFLIAVAIVLFKKIEESTITKCISFSFLAFFLHNLIDFNFINPAVAVLFFITGGVAVAGQQNDKFMNYKSLTKVCNFLIILLLGLSVITYIRYALSQRAILLSERERDINNKLYYIERAGKLYPANFEIYEKKGDVFYTLFNVVEKDPVYLREAEISYLQAVTLNPMCIGAYRKLAFLYEGLCDYQKAEGMFLKVLELYPDKKQYNMEVAMFYKTVGNEDKFHYYYEKSRHLTAITIEEGLAIEEYEKWIESQK
ncbi:MAG: O-antigen ligase family protein [Candidatus Ratteibacteria bacterium]|nr:O-antigen ligase family protein [Candidatus Ratteibacteria bacterium]